MIRMLATHKSQELFDEQGAATLDIAFDVVECAKAVEDIFQFNSPHLNFPGCISVLFCSLAETTVAVVLFVVAAEGNRLSRGKIQSAVHDLNGPEN